MKYDVAIIGCGITGSAIALELSKYDLKVLVIEKENDVAMMTTKANSAIIHAGYDPLPGTRMARDNVLGSRLTEELAEKMNFHYKKIGSLVIGRKDKDKGLIDTLYERGCKNGVKDLKILDGREEILSIGEENLSEDIDYALYAPSAAIVSPWEMCLAFITTAVHNGVKLVLDTKVEEISFDHEFTISTNHGYFMADYVINAAGLYADDVYASLLRHKDFEITPVKGEYYLLDKDMGSLFHHVIFQTPSNLGKGVLVSPTVHGNLIVGPNAEETSQKNKVNVTPQGLSTVRQKALLTTQKINFFDNIRNFAGNRAQIKGYDDFLIGPSPIYPHFINFAGIKSPGLSSAAAFGLEAKDILTECGLKMNLKSNFEYERMPNFFKDLPLEEKEEMIKKDNRYGRVICRCETITEGEIVAALHSAVPATTIDGVKRRTNAGMGRCQGGFCAPKVFEIIQRELGLGYDKIYQDRDGSQVVVSRTKEDAR
jgi:glycerol-3-phosphate dehydrogenase